MKKTLVMGIAAGLVMLGAAGQASATMTLGDLIMVGYNTTTNEVGVDLGSMASVLSGLSAAPKTLATGLDFSPAAGADNAPVSLGFFQDGSNWNTYDVSIYFATTSPTATAYSSTFTNVQNQFSPAATQIIGYYNQKLVSANTAVGSPTFANSYDMSMNMGTKGPGNYAGVNSNLAVGEAKDILAGGPVDMYLYHFILNQTNGLIELAPASASQDWTVKLTLDNGTLTAVNTNAVPVPATALLFGSSLLGLLGIRRKNS